MLSVCSLQHWCRSLHGAAHPSIISYFTRRSASVRVTRLQNSLMLIWSGVHRNLTVLDLGRECRDPCLLAFRVLCVPTACGSSHADDCALACSLTLARVARLLPHADACELNRYCACVEDISRLRGVVLGRKGKQNFPVGLFISFSENEVVPRMSWSLDGGGPYANQGVLFWWILRAHKYKHRSITAGCPTTQLPSSEYRARLAE